MVRRGLAGAVLAVAVALAACAPSAAPATPPPLPLASPSASAPASASSPAPTPAALPSASPAGGLLAVPSPSPVLATGATGAGAAGAPLTRLNVSYSETTPEIAWFWVTIDSGLFAQHGLDVETSQITSVEGMAAFLSGETDIGNTGGPDTLNAVANGADIVVIAVTNGVSPFRIYAPADISSMADLQGQPVGISQFGGASEMQMRLALQLAGVDPSSVSYIQTGSTQARTTALLQGTIKAAAANPLEGQTLLAQGMHVIYDLSNQPWAEGTVTVRRDWLAQHQDVVQAYVDALVQGIQLYKTNKAYTVSVMEKYFQTTDEAAMSSAYDDYINVVPSLPTPTLAELQPVQAVLATTNPAVANVDLNHLIDTEFVDSAQSRGLGQ